MSRHSPIILPDRNNCKTYLFQKADDCSLDNGIHLSRMAPYPIRLVRKERKTYNSIVRRMGHYDIQHLLPYHQFHRFLFSPTYVLDIVRVYE